MYSTRRLILLGALFLTLITYQTTSSQNVSDRLRFRLESPEQHPGKHESLAKVARLKIALRKSNFALDEMMSLDIALLNNSDSPIYFPSLWSVKVTAKNQRGEEIVVNPYSIPSSDISYKKLEPKRYESRSLRLYIGCSETLFASLDELRAAKDDVEIFDKGLFLTYGDSCLGAEADAYVTISAEVSNEKVVVINTDPSGKTAVGTLKSNSVKIRVGK